MIISLTVLRARFLMTKYSFFFFFKFMIRRRVGLQRRVTTLVPRSTPPSTYFRIFFRSISIPERDTLCTNIYSSEQTTPSAGTLARLDFFFFFFPLANICRTVSAPGRPLPPNYHIISIRQLATHN